MIVESGSEQLFNYKMQMLFTVGFIFVMAANKVYS